MHRTQPITICPNFVQKPMSICYNGCYIVNDHTILDLGDSTVLRWIFKIYLPTQSANSSVLGTVADSMMILTWSGNRIKTCNKMNWKIILRKVPAHPKELMCIKVGGSSRSSDQVLILSEVKNIGIYVYSLSASLWYLSPLSF